MVIKPRTATIVKLETLHDKRGVSTLRYLYPFEEKMKKPNKMLLSLLIAVGLISAVSLFTPVQSFAQSADEIAKKAHLAAYYTGDDGSAQMLMRVYAKGAKKPIQKMFYMMKMDQEEGGRQLFFTYFSAPSDIKRTTFLVKKHIDQDDFRRLYLPASDKVLAISGSRKQDPFMGSDFSYEDVSGRHFSRDSHKILGEEKLNGKSHFVMQATPKETEDRLARMKYWVDKETYLPMKVEFYDRDGKLYKKYRSEKIATIQGYPTILTRVMESPLDGTKTVILVNPKRVRYNVGFKESDFSERSLKNPPAKFLK